MKKIFLMAMSAALAFVACDKDNYKYSGLEDGYGRLSFAEADLTVSEELETRANTYDANDGTIIWVLKPDGEFYDLNTADDAVTYTTYGSVKEKGIDLPALPNGEQYKLRVQTAAEIKPAGTSAVYGLEQDFTITAGETTNLRELTLKLYKQVKVSVGYNDEFKSALTSTGGTTTVTIDGENVLTFNVNANNVDTDSKYLYLELTDENKDSGVSMEVNVVVEMNVKEEGSNVTSVKTQKMSATVQGVKPCQYRQIQINKEKIEDGGANFTIVVDGLEVDTELTTDVSAEEGKLEDDPNAPKGDGGINLINIAGVPNADEGGWNLYTEQTEAEIVGKTIKGIHKPSITVNGLTELSFNAIVPESVLDFYVDITSTNTDFNTAVKGISVKNDGRIYLTKTDKVHSDVVTGLNGLGIPFPLANDVINKSEISFPLTSAIEPLTGFKGTHYFIMNVIDKGSHRNTIVLTLIVE